MEERVLETTLTPALTIEARGHLAVKGSEISVVRAQSSQPALTLAATAEEHGAASAVQVGCAGGLEVHTPIQSAVTIQAAYSETLLEGLHGPLVVEAAYGKLVLLDTGDVHIRQANGSVVARQVGGNCTIERANGSVSVQGVAGQFRADSVGGNLTLSQAAGAVQATIYGNGFLDLAPQPGATYQVKAYGNLTCRLPVGVQASARLVGYGAAVVKVGAAVHKAQSGEALELTFGEAAEGVARLELEASGSLTVLESGVFEAGTEAFDAEIDLGAGLEAGLEAGMLNLAADITRQVSEQLTAQMAAFDLQVERLAAAPGLSEEKRAEMRQRAHEKTERAREKIQQAAERAAAKMERKMEAAQRRAEQENERVSRISDRASRRAEELARRAEEMGRRGEEIGRSVERKMRGFNFKFNFGGLSAPAAPKAPARPGAASEEEKMVVLQMLADKKITAEQADSLLAALEGRE